MPQMSNAEYKDFLARGTRTAMLATTREDGRPYVSPIWFVLDGDEIVFITGKSSVKGLAIRHNGRVALSVDYEQEPYAFALIEGTATVSEDPEEVLRWSTRIAARYIGEEKAAEYAESHVPSDEILVRVKPTRVLGGGYANNEQHMPTSPSVLEAAS